MAKKEQTSSKSRLGLWEKLVVLLILIVAYIAAGFIRFGGYTPLEHLDRLADTGVFQGSHDALVDWVLDIEVPHVKMPDMDMKDFKMPDIEMPDIDFKRPDKAKKKASDSPPAPKREKKKVKQLEEMQPPMEEITEEEQEEIGDIIEKKGGK